MKCILTVILNLGILLPRLTAEVSPGEIFISEMNCVACHAAAPNLTARLSPRAAPKLAKEGVSKSPRWIREFLADPQKVKPETLMPDLLHGIPADEKAGVIEALTHFLVSIQPAEERPQPSPGTAAVESGRTLYHETGCVQCHAPEVLPPRQPKDEASAAALAALQKASIPLGDLAGKFTQGSLAGFLRDPLRSRPSGRMPAMQLTPGEAAAVSAYLLRDQAPATSGAMRLDPDKTRAGAKWFVRLRCAACHADAAAGITAEAQPGSPRPLAQMRSRQPAGCLSSKPKPGTPKFELTDRQRSVILVALQSQEILALPLNAEQQVRRAMTVLNCYACHARDRRGGAGGLRREYFTSHGTVDLGDEGRVPPALTGVGARLDPARLRDSLISGSRTRPAMATRMPVYGEANVTDLILLLSETPK